MTGTEPDSVDLVNGTTDILLRALRELGKSGKPDSANRLAARAWVLLKSNYPREAQRLNGLMHYLARLPELSSTPAVSQLSAMPQLEEHHEHRPKTRRTQ